MSSEGKNKNTHYISAKESRQIAKDNTRTIKELQKKRKSYKREDYVTEMRDPNNIVEFDNLHTYFFTEFPLIFRKAPPSASSENRAAVNPLRACP